MHKNILPFLFTISLFIYLVSGVPSSSADIAEKSTANPGGETGLEDVLESIPAPAMLGLKNFVYMGDADAVELRVGETCIFYKREPQSQPNRWHYLISDATLIRVSSDKIDRTLVHNSLPGGDHNTYRSIGFVALAPGECVISFRQSPDRVMDWDNEFLYERIYTIVITE